MELPRKTGFARSERSAADWEAFEAVAARLHASMAAKGITEEEIVAEFKRMRAAERQPRQGRVMLFMVIEHFRNGDPKPIAERFQSMGRMLPEGLTYQASWIDPAGARCFQLMETARPELFDEWISHWSDLVEFEVVPVLTSADFWAGRVKPGSSPEVAHPEAKG